MANITLDFLHNYHTGERRESDPENAYQYDEGHVLEAVLPEVVTSAEINYWIRGMENADAYAPGSITPNEDGSCTVLGNIPNKYFETNGELRIYIVVNDDNASITTYEGMLHICQRSMPDDYVDDDPENEATRVLTEARAAAETATAAAQTAQEVADSIPADYTQLSDDVSSLKEDITSCWVVSALSGNDYEQGSLSASDASDIYSTTRIKTKTYLPDNAIYVKPKNGYKLSLYVWDVNGTYLGVWNGSACSKTVSSLNWTTSGWNLTSFDQLYKFKLILAKSDDSSITVSDYANLLLSFPTDTGLSISGKAADAKVTGDMIADLSSNIKTRYNLDKKNLYRDVVLFNGRVYDGEYQSSITAKKCTDYIPLIPGHRYAIYGGFLADHYVWYYDSDKSAKNSIQFTELLTAYPYNGNNNHGIFTAPSDAWFMRISFNAGETWTIPTEYYFYDITENEWADKKLLVIGDSISTDYYGGYKKWVTDLIQSGHFLLPNVTNDSIHATGFIATYDGGDNAFITRLQTHDPDDFDCLVVFGGINDYIQSVDYDTFKTAVDTFFTYVTTHFYKDHVCVFSPLRTASTNANSAGHIQQDYADYIKQVAKSYCIPILNLTEESGFYPFVDEFKNQWTIIPTGYEVHDGVHPTEEWERDFLVPQVLKFLKGIL